MKKAVLMTLVVFFILPAGYGQVKKRPVKPDVWRSFTPPDESFSVLLPAPPSSDVPNKVTFGGFLDKGGSERYLSVRGNERYFIGVSDFYTPPDEAGRNEKYETIFWPYPADRKAFAGRYPGVERSEGFWGGEDVFGVNAAKAVYRVFIVEDRQFVLAAIVPGNQSPLNRRRYQAKINKFFSSFRIRQMIPTLRSPSAYIPETFGISLNEQNFKSEVLGLTIQLPAGWKTVHHPDSYLTARYTLEDMLSGFATNRQKIVLATAPGGTPEFWLAVEQREFLDTTLSEFVQKRARFNGGSVSRHVIGRHEFLRIDLLSDITDSPYMIRRYYTEWNGYILEVGMSYAKETGNDVMEASLNTLAALGRQ